MSKKKDCRFCEQGWTPCEEHGHSSMCNKYLNGHYKEIVFEQDEILPTPQPTGSNHPTTDKELEIKIGMLRQWLNEERIKDADRFVTNDDIKMWLDLDNQIAKHTAAARIDELNWLPNDITGLREYVANRRLELQATNPEESNHAI